MIRVLIRHVTDTRLDPKRYKPIIKHTDAEAGDTDGVYIN